ncbi:para-nitrobenzyl esterase [Aaosphaeria arxii CBS 175.79]|uniref:Carboxylic ester hydrolase n=1 Tax=Aaosphaeria arxii CBS 175.79 TaxID=1450172 RepID=A0A6A5XN39_9PLEO|nr:para-nitrobenzyl esterase [Aaosphaeria arxii CBS 175.79]KAF2014299.1 para-nitrobenzyl esterase [Aaosphaeria arxii CBS 175.79]
MFNLSFSYYGSLFLGVQQWRFAQAVNTLNIDTTSGYVTGTVDRTAPNVAQFLGIPYAEQPVGSRRWLPSVAKERAQFIDATKFGPSCPQFEGNASNVWRTDAPEFLPEPEFGEDCLSVNIWAPWTGKRWNGTSNDTRPVIVWIHGGAFLTGGVNTPYHIPTQWVQRRKDLIVVAINYRLNIFGFPNARGTVQNLGLLDQRLALEWIQENIANFGGDPERITLWGQSAGAIAADLYNYAYPEDSIVSSYILSSGNTYTPLQSLDFEQNNFTFVAKHFGCGNLTATAELDCMRNVSSTDIIGYLKSRVDSTATPALSFNIIVDNSTKFSNNTARAIAGNYTKKPAIIGTTSNEGIAFLPYNRTYGPDQAIGDYYTLWLFICTEVKTTQDRFMTGSTTYRYLYAGNFSNISPLPWLGAYHSADLPLVFGTYDIARGEGTSFQTEVSEQLQDYWTAFAKDPINGLPELGWDAYEPEGDAVLIGWEGQVVQPFPESDIDIQCDGLLPREGAVSPP